jgi:RNA polymerase sigma-70 factor, ECF subfamily
MAVVHNQSHQVTTADPAAARGAAVAEIEAVYRSRLDAFVRVCTALLGSREQAIDAVHDGFAAALTRRASYRGDGSIEGWLWAVVVNAARNHRRALALRTAGAGHDGGEPATAAPPPPDDMVRDHVAQLPERQRLVLFLRYYADLDYQEIAEAVGIAVGTVGSTLSAAHTALHAALAEEAHDD